MPSGYWADPRYPVRFNAVHYWQDAGPIPVCGTKRPANGEFQLVSTSDRPTYVSCKKCIKKLAGRVTCKVCIKEQAGDGA